MLSNILLDELDKELKRKGANYVRYADDFSIYVKSKADAKKIGNEIYLFLKDKLDLPINKEMHEYESTKGTHVVLAYEDLQLLNYSVTVLYPPTRRVKKANTN